MEQFCQLCDAQAPEDGIAEELQFVEELYREKKKSFEADFETSLASERSRVRAKRANGTRKAVRSENPAAGTSDNELAARLPQYELPKFNGDFTRFRSLWDQFENCVHQRPSLSNATKLAYLRSCLSRKALVAITCLCSSKSDYEPGPPPEAHENQGGVRLGDDLEMERQHNSPVVDSDARRWKLFVVNRVREIQDLIPLDRWQHCSATDL
ncbi:hypothetical protein T10_9628 [Trichinella papuae]|uniref:Uncharacterized protein n=1 Tax=Trichinella papuae TaxID=268474 RepID=A0A0V1MJW9_9BILA|nr:hypothetical protein T10_9628 [Trichinella papuae]